MNVEHALADMIVRCHRVPDAREAMVEALFAIRRYRWAETPPERRRSRRGLS